MRIERWIVTGLSRPIVCLNEKSAREKNPDKRGAVYHIEIELTSAEMQKACTAPLGKLADLFPKELRQEE
jgi:hypothetical protein